MSGFKQQPKGFATKAIHVGQEPEQWKHLAVVPPLVTSTTFKQLTPGETVLFHYSRLDNPSRHVLEQCLASLDNAKHSLAFSSGMGACTILLQLLSSGDHILASDAIYGGTYTFITEVASRQGIEFDFVDGTNLEKVKTAIKSNTRMIWMESSTNPCMQILDVAGISKIAHSHPNVIVVVDNTFLTPYFQRPLELGADIVSYSLSKYMNGHTDVTMGSVATNSDELGKRMRFLQKASGIVPSPFDCYQVNRSLKTLALRMEQHSKNSLIVAKYLESHPCVERVLHPGLPSHSQHKLALKQSYGHSGMMAFYIKGGLAESMRFVKSMKLFTLASSLGGYESLAGIPMLMTHYMVPEEERKKVGITDALIRLSIGLEDADDLIADLNQALISATNAA